MTALSAHELLLGRRLLVVEDDYLMARALTRALGRAGAEVLDPVPSVAAALSVLEQGARPDASILDINLGHELVYPVADALLVRRLPFLFLTGHDPARVPERFAQATLCEKPVLPAAMPAEVRRVLEPPWTVAIVASGEQGAEQARELLAGLPLELNAIVLLALRRMAGERQLEANLKLPSHPIEVARSGRRLQAGMVYVGSARSHLMLAAHGTAQIFDDPSLRYADRSRNLLLRSVACWAGARTIVVALPEACELIRNELEEVRGVGGEVHAPHARLSVRGVARRIVRRVEASGREMSGARVQ